MGGGLELAQDRAQWGALAVRMLNLRVLLPQYVYKEVYSISRDNEYASPSVTQTVTSSLESH
jgi:hypothetical protein